MCVCLVIFHPLRHIINLWWALQLLAHCSRAISIDCNYWSQWMLLKMRGEHFNKRKVDRKVVKTVFQPKICVSNKQTYGKIWMCIAIENRRFTINIQAAALSMVFCRECALIPILPNPVWTDRSVEYNLKLLTNSTIFRRTFTCTHVSSLRLSLTPSHSQHFAPFHLRSLQRCPKRCLFMILLFS